MGRPAKFTEDQLLDAAVKIIDTDGPMGLTLTSVARAVGAPSGSLYHRFPSRDHLAGALWLRAAERFQASWAEAVNFADGDAVEAVRASVKFTLAWSREHPGEARVLLLYRSADLLSDAWPPDLVERNEHQIESVQKVVSELSVRLTLSTAEDRRRLWFALFDLPVAAIRSAITTEAPLAHEVDAMVDDAVRAVLAGLGQG